MEIVFIVVFALSFIVVIVSSIVQLIRSITRSKHRDAPPPQPRTYRYRRHDIDPFDHTPPPDPFEDFASTTAPPVAPEPPAAPVRPTNCPHCGGALEEDSKFCPYCGHKL